MYFINELYSNSIKFLWNVLYNNALLQKNDPKLSYLERGGGVGGWGALILKFL